MVQHVYGIQLSGTNCAYSVMWSGTRVAMDCLATETTHEFLILTEE